jgi:hypothetical protein
VRAAGPPPYCVVVVQANHPELQHVEIHGTAARWRGDEELEEEKSKDNERETGRRGGPPKPRLRRRVGERWAEGKEVVNGVEEECRVADETVEGG